MRSHKLLIGVAVIVVALVATVAFLRATWGDDIDTSKVVSIKAAPGYQDAKLLDKAWQLPVAQLYHRDVDYQRNGSFCGPASVVNVDRSLGVKVDQGTALEGTGISTTFGILPGGVTLDELAGIAEKKLPPESTVKVVRDIDLAAFRSILKRVNDPSVRVIANFTRASLFATGGGHHSPIAGYLPEDDLVFVLDVNEKYQPWLVKPDRLFDAMNTIDKQAGKKRGLLLIETPTPAR